MSDSPKRRAKRSDPRLEHLQRALVVVAHPDDVDFGAAGTVAHWTEAGVEVTYCVVTDGEAGGLDDEPDRAKVARMRRLEQESAATEVGVSQLEFLGYADGRVQPTLGLRRDLARVIRTYRPNRIVAPSPQRRWDRIGPSHPDHLAVGEATLRAVFPDARTKFAHPELADEGLEPWTVPEVWLMASPQPNTYVDITETLEAKLGALACHRSQHPVQDGLRVMVEQHLRKHAKDAKLGKRRYAEAFQQIDAT
ncbi:MAG: PIG-L deacetylase family protein [Microthrixaceae bacterium]